MKRKANQFKPEEKPRKKKKGKSTTKATASKRSEMAMRILGFFLLLAALYLFFACVSFLVSWFTWSTDDIFTNISFSRIFNDPDIKVHNWTGRLGAALAHQLMKEWIGVSAFFAIGYLFLAGLKTMTGLRIFAPFRSLLFVIIAILWFSVTLGFIFHHHDMYSILGGVFGYVASDWLSGFVGNVGLVFLILFVLVSYLMISGIIPLGRKKKGRTKKPAETEESKEAANIFKEDRYNTMEFTVDEEEDNPVKEEKNDEEKERNNPGNNEDPSSKKDNIELTIEKTEKESTVTSDKDYRGTLDTTYDPTLDLPEYKFPKLDLLNDYQVEPTSVAKEELEENKNRIVETLNHYQIQIDKIKATIGPTVTLYEIIPAPGVRISKIRNLDDDIALSLSAKGIRIIAPIPGKGTIGIEVPNQHPEIVSIKSMISSRRFQETGFELPIALGKTISNESYIADLTKMPHILMAGATGQGKSVGLNAIITSLLYKKHPSQLKFVLIDPKKVELTLFSKIERHFLAKLPDTEEAIVTETRTVVRTLNSLCIEMDHRYELLKDAQVRNIREYNEKFVGRKLNPEEGHRFLPYIVLIVDEFADLIMTSGKEIESPLTRLAQLARATGIHLVIATQRPSVNIITGTIKANFPARIAYRVISKVDSRTILDSGGADQLVGRGDMLLSTGSDLLRLQCAFVDTPEVDNVTDFIGSQRAYPSAFYLPEYMEEEDIPSDSFDPNERDELFEDAARVIVQNQQGSTSLLQRKLKLGYNRAGRIIDQLEAAGIVGPFEGSKARDVLVGSEMALEQFLKDLYSKESNNEE